jgi:cyanophycin synthetase
MITIIEKFRSYPGYCFGVNQPATIGKILINLDRKDELALIKASEGLIGIKYLSEHNLDGKKINLIDFICKAIIFIQQSFRIPISSTFFTYEDSEDNQYHIIILPTLSSQANKLCVEFLLSFFIAKLTMKSSLELKTKTDAEFAYVKKKLSQIGSKGQNYFYLINAALELKIPVLSFNPELLRLGLGKHQICMNSTISERTSFIGAHLSHNKRLTSRLLNDAGLPGTKCFKVKNDHEAIVIAEKIQYPVVIKPENLDGGQGVYAYLTDEKMVSKYYKKCLNFSKNIMVEKHYDGLGHRLTVLNNQVVKVTKKIPLGIIGDGELNVAELISRKNKDQQIAFKANHQIELDEDSLELLQQFNLKPTSIIEINRFIPLRRINNSTAGGDSEVIPIEKVHPDNIDLAIQASNLFWLDIAGIDLIIPNIEESWLNQTCAICEINVMPQTDDNTIKIMLTALAGKSIEIEFHLGVCLESDLEFISSEIQALSTKLICNGHSSKKGLVIENKIVSRHFDSTFQAALSLAQHRSIKRGLMVVTLEELEQFKLPLNNFSGVHLLGSLPNKLQRHDKNRLDLLLNSLKPHIKKYYFKD